GGADGGWHKCRSAGLHRRCLCSLARRLRLALVLEALAAEHRATLGRLKRNGGRDAALGTLRPRLHTRDACGGGVAGVGARSHGASARLAGLAALGVVFELLVQEEQLFPGGEYELAAT